MDKDRVMARPIVESMADLAPESLDGNASSSFDESEPARSTSGMSLGATLRAEGQHEFSPYSQLFNENRKSKQP